MKHIIMETPHQKYIYSLQTITHPCFPLENCTVHGLRVLVPLKPERFSASTGQCSFKRPGSYTLNG